MEFKQKIKSFKDLDVWKESHKLVLMIYKITKSFPKDELFGLVSQIRRILLKDFLVLLIKKKLNFIRYLLARLPNWKTNFWSQRISDILLVIILTAYQIR